MTHDNVRNSKSVYYNVCSMVIYFIALFSCVSVISIVSFFEKLKHTGNISNIPGYVYLLVSIIFLLMFKFLFEKINEDFSQHFDKLILISVPVFFLIQVFVFLNIFFVTGWDSGYNIVPSAYAIAYGNFEEVQNLYFSRSPNNMLITLIIAFLIKINRLFGLYKDDFELMIVVSFNSLISSLTSYLVYKTIKTLFSNTKISIFAYVLSVLMISLSPWNVICYTDAVAVLFPVMLFYISIRIKENQLLRSVLLFCITYIGYCIKPTVAIITIAIMLIDLVRFINNRWDKRKMLLDGIFQGVISIFMSIIVVLIISGILGKIYALSGFRTNSNYELGMPHFFMMGQNDVTMGVYHLEDVIFSNSISDKEERDTQNIRVALDRIKHRGFLGELLFTARKILTNFDDGTFAWEGEGEFYREMKPDRFSFSSQFKNFYYSSGTRFWIFKTITQFIWVMVLVMNCTSVIMALYRLIKEKYVDYNYVIIVTSLIGVFIYSSVFEARARYLYLYIPIYIICAMYSLKNRFGNIILLKK